MLFHNATDNLSNSVIDAITVYADDIKGCILNEYQALDFIKLLAPFAPHFSEEEWSYMGKASSVFNEQWPSFDSSALVEDEIEIAIQINGKIKARINIPSSYSEDEIKKAALENETIIANTEGKNIVKVIIIKGRLVNIVVK